MPQDPFTSDPFAGDSDPFAVPAPEPEPKRGRWGDYVGGAIRGLAGFFGAEGFLPGALIQGAGELGAQTVERVGGSRESFNLPQVGAAGAIGAVPFGKQAGLAARYLKGMLFGGSTGAVMEAAREVGDQEDVDLAQIGRAGVSGGIFGTAGAGAGHLLERVLGPKAASELSRRQLREEADAATTLPKHRPGRDEVIDVRGGGGPGAPPPPAGTPAGPLTTQDQLLGIDPDRVRAAVGERQVPQVRQPNRVIDVAGDGEPGVLHLGTGQPQPRVRSEGNIVDVEGPVSGEIGLNQTPRVRSESGVRDVGDGPPTEPFTDNPLPQPPQVRQPSSVRDVTPAGPVEPFEGPEAPTLPSYFVRDMGKGDRESMPIPAPRVTREPTPAGPRPAAATEAPSVAPAPTPAADDAVENALDEAFKRDSFLDRFMQAVNLAADRKAGVTRAPETPAPAPTPAPSSGPRTQPFTSAEVYAAWKRLLPKWEQTLAETGVDQRETLADFTRRVASETNPRKLMGAERKAVAATRARGGKLSPGAPPHPSSPPAVQRGGFADFLDDEAGEIDPELARRLGVHGASALLGGAAGYFGSDEDTRERNAVGGALLGAAAPLAFSGKGLDALNKLRYFSMLGGVGAQAKNLVGNAGSATVRAAEEALVGNRATAKDLLASVFSPETVARAREAFSHADVPGDSRWGQTSGAVGVPSRMMHAVDEAATGALRRGGLTEDEARLSLFTSQPRSKTGQAINNLGRHIPIVMPFTRTATNMVERGLEHTPGIGLLPQVRAMRGDETNRVMARQALGALALLTGAGLGSEVDRKYQPYIAAALGPLALPYAMGTEGKRAFDRRTGDPFTNVVKSPTDVIRDQLPLPGDSYDYDPARVIASFVPGILADASEVAPREFEQPGLFDPAIAKIPFLNSALLRRKPQRASAR